MPFKAEMKEEAILSLFILTSNFCDSVTATPRFLPYIVPTATATLSSKESSCLAGALLAASAGACAGAGA